MYHAIFKFSIIRLVYLAIFSLLKLAGGLKAGLHESLRHQLWDNDGC